MSAKIIDGKKIAGDIYAELETEIKTLNNTGITPHLSVVLVGEDPASKVYVGMKQKACERIGLGSETIRLDASISEQELLDILDKLNADSNVHGILVQLPLPKHISEAKVIETVSPEKDVDGFHPISRGRLATGDDTFIPCTPAGIQQLLIRSGYNPEGQHVVIIGRSKIVGLPFALMMAQKKSGANATVTLCHTGTKDIKQYSLQADILVVAAGRPEVVTADIVPSGCVVIDVGVNRVEDATAKRGYRLVGDVEFDSVSEKAKAITPVPGGVGPMTIAMLINNTVKAAKSFSK